MRWLSLICVCLVPVTVLAQGRLGTPVVEVRIEGAPAEVLDDVPIPLGSTLTRGLLRAAIQALYDRGAYGRIDVEAVEALDAPDGGTVLVFRVDAPYFFSTMRVEPRGILERSLGSYTNLPFGERFSMTRLEEIVATLRDRLEDEGYFDTRITPEVRRDEETRLVTVVLRTEAGPPAEVRSVRFTGGEQTFTEEQLRDAFNVRVGRRFLAERVVDGEENLRALFADVADRAGFLNTSIEVVRTWDPATNMVDLDVRVAPGAYAFVDLRGVDLSDERLRELVPVFEEGSVEPELIEEGRINIQEYFVRDGYFDARVSTPAEPIRTPMDPTRPDESLAVQIIYDVAPGDRYSVAAVRIQGNTLFEDREIRDAIGLASRGVFSRGVYSPELLDDAIDTVQGMYRALGLPDTEVVGSSEVAGSAITVTIDIREGSPQRVATVSVVGNAVLETDEVVQTGQVVVGDVYRPAGLEAGRRAILAEYHTRGYAETTVRTEVAGSGEGRVGVTYRIEEGRRWDIGEIVVSGTQTRETVVRRYAAPLEEAVPYDPEAVLEAQRSLYATGLFSRVDIVPLGRGPSDRRDLLIQAEDAGRLLLTYGVGIQEGLRVQDQTGSSDGGVDVRGIVELVHSNLWWLNRSVSARVQGSRHEQSFQTTYREPQLFNWNVDGYASFFVERAQTPQFEASRIDFSLQTLYEFANSDNLLLTASFETVNPESRINQIDPGNVQVATVGASYIRDNRDDAINPTRGNYFLGTLRVGQPAYGSDVNFTSLFTQVNLYRPARTAVIAGSVRFGWNQPYGGTADGTTAPLPITEKYFAGGSTTLRAFGLDEAGPRGGGDALFLLNLEYRQPLRFLFSDLSGALFYDTGTIFPSLSDFTVGDFTHTAGVGLRYRTPLGPVRVDVGFNLNRQPPRFPAEGDPGERTYKLHLTLGHAF